MATRHSQRVAGCIETDRALLALSAAVLRSSSGGNRGAWGGCPRARAPLLPARIGLSLLVIQPAGPVAIVVVRCQRHAA